MYAAVFFGRKDVRADGQIVVVAVDELEGKHSGTSIQHSALSIKPVEYETDYHTRAAGCWHLAVGIWPMELREPGTSAQLAGPRIAMPAGPFDFAQGRRPALRRVNYLFLGGCGTGATRRTGTIAPREGSAAAVARDSTSSRMYFTNSWIWCCISSIRSRICRMIAIPEMFTPKSRASDRMNSSR